MKKVLSFVLVLSLVLSSFSMAFAGEVKTGLTDIAGTANEEAIQVVNDLGIVTGYTDGTFKAEKSVNRAEFAVMLTKALAIPESALAAYTATNFTDVAGYEWAIPYLAFCESKGIMSGYGEGIVKPGNTITVNEAMTMALRAIGYTPNSAELVGTWPSNYVTKAQELGIYEDVAAVATVDRGSAAQIVYNVLTEEKVAVDADGNTYGLGGTLLTTGLDCVAEEGQVVSNNNISESVINMAQYLGQYGDIYRDRETDKIVAFVPDNDVLIGKFANNNVEFVAADETVYNLACTTVGATALNGNVNLADQTIVAYNGANTDLGGAVADTVVLSADISGKTIKTIYCVSNWEITQAAQIEAGDLELIEEDELLTCEFILDDNDEIDYTQFALVGAASLKDIKADDVVYVYADSNEIRRIEVGTKTVTGVIKTFKNPTSTANAKFTVNGVAYQNAAGVINEVYNFVGAEDVITAANVGDEVTLTLDSRGYVFAVESADAVNDYAVMIARGNSTLTDEGRVLFADGTKKVVEFDVDEFATTLAGTTASGFQLFGYSLDKDGVIDAVDTNVVTETAATLSSLYVLDGASSDYKVAKDVVVFTYDDSDDTYGVTTIDKVELDTALAATGLNVVLLVDELGEEVLAMIIDVDATKGGEKSYAVVNDYTKTTNADDDTVFDVVGYKNGAKMAMTTDEAKVIGDIFAGYTTPVYTDLTSVQLYEIVVDAKGIIVETDLITDADRDVTTTAALTVAKADGRKSVTVSGTVYALDANVVVYRVNSDNEYVIYNGSLQAGDTVLMYNLDDSDDNDYDVVFFAR